MKVSEENFDECRESSAFVDDGLVCPLEISYFYLEIDRLWWVFDIIWNDIDDVME